MTTSTFYLSCSPKCSQKPPSLLHGTSVNGSWSNGELSKKNTSACKACINRISQWRAYHLFSLWWCASLLLVSEAQTPGWDVSLCVQVESVVCQCFPVYYPACQKNSGRDMRGKHSGELHPILFFFSRFFSPRDVSSQLKGYVSQHHFNVLTPQLWGVEIGKKHCRRAVLWCQWTPKVQHERGDFVYVRVYLLTTSPCCYSSVTSPKEMNNVQMGKHSLFAVHSDSIYFGSHSNVLFCSQISSNGFTVLSFRLFVHWVRSY